jgi:hypothetical protein
VWGVLCALIVPSVFVFLAMHDNRMTCTRDAGVYVKRYLVGAITRTYAFDEIRGAHVRYAEGREQATR